MAKRGRKKGCSNIEAALLRQHLFEACDRLHAEERIADKLRASYLPRAYYVDKLFELRIAPWSKSRINRLLMYRFRYESK